MRQDEIITEAILELATKRGAGKTICPSEVARHIGGADEGQWRPLMNPVREQAIKLAQRGEIDIQKQGETVDVDSLTGIYRIGIRAK